MSPSRGHSRGVRALVISLSLCLLAASCSDDDDGGGDDAAPTTEESSTTTTTTGSTTTEGSTTTTAPEVEAAFTEAPTCDVQLPEGLTVTPRCGTVAVPLDHDDPSGETIDIAVVVFPATPQGGSQPVDDPVILLGGGPGQKSVENAGLIVAPIAPVLRERDVVVFDQRGVGASTPALECPQIDALGPNVGPATDEAVAAAEQCYQQLTADGVDLSAFDTGANVEDIDVIRRALEYEDINLVGTSYGARLALQYARDHSDNLRALVANSPVPAEANFIADAVANLDTTLEALFSACEADAACAAANPDLAANLDKVVAAVEQQPPTVQIVDVMTGQMMPVVVEPFVLANSVFSFFYLTPLIGALPQAITAAAGGDLTPLIQGGSLFSQVAALTAGMQLSFVCAEEIAESDPDEVTQEAEELSALAESAVATLFEGFVRGCEVWEVEPEEAVFEPVETEVPTLVVTGEFDQITPVRYGEEIAEGLPNETLLEIPAAGHDPLTSTTDPECGASILIEFLEAPDEEPDTTCATSQELAFTSVEEALKVLTEGSGGG